MWGTSQPGYVMSGLPNWAGCMMPMQGPMIMFVGQATSVVIKGVDDQGRVRTERVLRVTGRKKLELT